MINNKTVAVVVPAYNEEKQILAVIETMPDFVDRIIVVNDKSTDRTEEIINQFILQDTHDTIEIPDIFNKIQLKKYNRAEYVLQEQLKAEMKLFTPSQVVNANPDKDRVILINQSKNGGVGAAISRGYKWCTNHAIDCTAVMAGDGQMDPEELESICNPVIYENVDYVKGNRLLHRSAWLVIPKIRFFGNSILSIMTKIASGYWHVSDTQTGYTAISNKALNAIHIYDIYKSYGMPNDMLVKLNIAFCTIREVEIKPIYAIGEKSKMKIFKVMPRITWLLINSFFKRLWIKYLFRNFHPLFILYHLSIPLFVVSLFYGIKILKLSFMGLPANPVTVLAFIFSFFTGIQFLLFAMWMDIQDNERLYK